MKGLVHASSTSREPRSLPTLAPFAASAMALLLASGQGPAQAPADLETLRPKVERLLTDLDGRFERGDVAGYLAAFRPDHRGQHAMLGQRLGQLLGASSHRQRRSELVAPLRQVGPRVVARMHSTVMMAADPQGLDRLAQESGAGLDDGTTRFVEDNYLILEVTADGSLRPTGCIEVAPETKCVANGRFRCPPCNYEVGGVPGWLCVPVRSDRAHALEAVSFHLLGTDVVVDVSVEFAAEPRPAATWAAQVAGSLQSLAGAMRLHPVEPWVPPAHRSAVPKGLDAARLVLDLPQDGTDEQGAAALLHVALFGGLQHLLLLRGSKTALQRHAASVDALLGSFRLLQVDDQAVHAATAALAHHCGGLVEGSRYRNVLYDLVLQGPEGWTLQQRTGGAAFRAVWTAKNGARLWLTGHQVPPGMEAWTQATADAWLLHLCEQQQLVLVECTDDVWVPSDAAGGQVRSFRAKPTGGEAMARQPATRQVRAVLRPELLVIAVGYGVEAADEGLVTEALGSLKRP